MRSRIAGRSEATYISPSPRPSTRPPACPVRPATSRSGQRGVHDGHGVRPPDLGERPAGGLGQVGAGVHLALDEVGDDLGVGLRGEAVPLGLQLGPQGLVVLHDPVVGHHRPPRQSAWGWALRSVGGPWVAQRVWPMATRPRRPASSAATAATSRSSLPGARRTTTRAPRPGRRRRGRARGDRRRPGRAPPPGPPGAVAGAGRAVTTTATPAEIVTPGIPDAAARRARPAGRLCRPA